MISINTNLVTPFFDLRRILPTMNSDFPIYTTSSASIVSNICLSRRLIDGVLQSLVRLCASIDAGFVNCDSAVRVYDLVEDRCLPVLVPLLKRLENEKRCSPGSNTNRV